jgi:hypothetical protein
MMFGVLASVNPTVSITGYVTFNISSSQVSVVGTIIDGYDADGNAIAFLDGKNFHYQDYTDREKTTLADWSINGGQPMYFKEDENGVTDIKVKFDFVNNSPFYTVAKFENVVATNNVNVTFDEQVIMDIKGGQQSSKSSTITYSVIDDSKTANSDINFSVTFERYLANGQTFAMFEQNFANQKPLTTEEVSQLQADYDKKIELEKISNLKTIDNQNKTDILSNNQSDANNTINSVGDGTNNNQNNNLTKNANKNFNDATNKIDNNIDNNNMYNKTNNNIYNNTNSDTNKTTTDDITNQASRIKRLNQSNTQN